MTPLTPSLQAGGVQHEPSLKVLALRLRDKKVLRHDSGLDQVPGYRIMTIALLCERFFPPVPRPPSYSAPYHSPNGRNPKPRPGGQLNSGQLRSRKRSYRNYVSHECTARLPLH